MGSMKRLLLSIGLATIAGMGIGAAAEPETAWRPGHPQACFKNGEALSAWFKERAQKLGGQDKLRILIIGDSLSDGGYHWSLFLTKPESGGSASPADPHRNVESELLVKRVTKAIPQTRLLFMINWAPRDGQSPPDAQTVKDRIAWYEANRYPYLNLEAGLDSAAMKQLGWFNDNIHLAQPGGQGIGEAIARLFLP